MLGGGKAQTKQDGNDMGGTMMPADNSINTFYKAYYY